MNAAGKVGTRMSEPAPAPSALGSAPAAPLEQGATAAPRLTAVDTFRGLTIMEVVAHHTSGVALRHAEAGSLAHELLLILNRTLHFAVPAFVFLSAVVLTRSLLKKFDLRRYFTRRVTRGAWPYLLWSGLYGVWYVATGQRPPEVLTDPERWSFYLLNGKASFHLYFLLVALEVYLLLPLLLPLARRRPAIGLMLALGLAAQLGAYFLNREVLALRFPASTVLWYLLPVLVGLGVGARLQEFPAWWRGRLPWLLGALAVAYALYIPVSTGNLRGDPVVPLHYNALNWTYSILVALTLLGAAYAWQERAGGWLRRAIATLGTVSLPIYLIHPALLQVLEYQVGFPDGGPGVLALTALGYFLVALLVPLLIGRLLLGKRLGLLLFGR